MSHKIFVSGALALALCAGAAAAAIAQTGLADQAIDAACANNGSALHWLVYILGGSVAASVLANFRNKLPPVVVTVLDTLAINFVKTLQASADAAKKSAPALLVLVLAGGVLAGCAAFNAKVVDPLITAISKINNTAIADLQTAEAVAKAATPPDADGFNCANAAILVSGQIQTVLKAAGTTNAGVLTTAELASLFQPGSAQYNAVQQELTTGCAAKAQDVLGAAGVLAAGGVIGALATASGILPLAAATP